MDAKSKLPADPGPLESYKSKVGKLISLVANTRVMQKDGPSIAERAFSIMPEDKIISVSQHLISDDRSMAEKEQALIWDYHANHHQSVRMNLRPILRALEFEEVSRLLALFKAY